MKLVVGLGNPGLKYMATRHNIGFRAVDQVASRMENLMVDRPFHRALVGQGVYLGEKIILAKPQTFMNLSGESVVRLLHWYKIDPADMIVIYDELDLEPGRLRIRECGSSGGHRGLASIINILKTENFTRLRLGIGRPPVDGQDISSWVLGRPNLLDEEAIDRVLQIVPEVVWEIVMKDVATAMNKYNGKNVV